MEEKILIKSERKDAKKICIAFPIVGVVLFLIYFAFSINSYRTSYSYFSGYTEIPFSEALSRSLSADGGLPFVALAIPVFAVVGFVLYKCWSKVEMTVTDKRVYGCAAFGKRVDLPLDAISAVGTSMFSGIGITTASGAIKFTMIANRDEIHETVSRLLVERQKKDTNVSTTVVQEIPQSSAEELKKYKDLLDSGVITQEEFDAKKKQLLGL